MITTFLDLIGAGKVSRWFMATVFITLAATAIYWWHTSHYASLREAAVQAAYERGRSDEHNIWSIASTEERERQRLANAQAIEQALSAVDQLTLTNAKLQDQLNDLNQEAEKADSRAAECLSPGILRKLNAIR
jgi:hypothetical protein